jgi:hypothetical protein
MGGRRSQRPGPSPTLGSLGHSHHRRHKSQVSLRGPPCAHGVSGIHFGEVRDRWCCKLSDNLEMSSLESTALCWRKRPMHGKCLRYQGRSAGRHIGSMMLFSVTQRSCWRRVEVLITGVVMNWSNGIRASEKPLPNSCTHTCYVKGRHGLRKEVVGRIRSEI